MAPSQHQEQSGHRLNNNPIIDKIKILDKELRDLHRKVLEAVHIKLRWATLSHNDGYNLPELYLTLLTENIWGEHPTDHCPPRLWGLDLFFINASFLDDDLPIEVKTLEETNL